MTWFPSAIVLSPTCNLLTDPLMLWQYSAFDPPLRPWTVWLCPESGFKTVFSIRFLPGLFGSTSSIATVHAAD
ncbi:hypothetical protein O181_070354 [Austropuccinia psidii MF-1]|uniref:Uncharacterized protein n=1 Tax=Austropuccinia psidii MF-1 TaxID=1389203 RepID=A0A9Q3F0N2_9BASI|nr:hypothetical protein [Austropuccinia psidii MF-1]